VNIVLAGADDAATTTTTTTTTTSSGGKTTKGGAKNNKGAGNATADDTNHHDNAPAQSNDKFSFVSGHGHADAVPHVGGLLGGMAYALAHAQAVQLAASLLHVDDVLQLDLHNDASALTDHSGDWLV
jgi:hypothetical protein